MSRTLSIIVVTAGLLVACGPSRKPAAPTGPTPPPTVAPTEPGVPAPPRAKQPGPPSDLPRVVKKPAHVKDVGVGYRHACVLLSTGAVRCWGYGGTGALGNGNTASIGDDEPVSHATQAVLAGRATAVAVGLHTCVVLEGGGVQCFGDGRFGRLGYGNTNNVGDDETPARAGMVDVGGKVVQLSAGASHTCAVVAGGNVKCWGRGSEGRLGLGNQDNVGDDEKPSSVGFVKLGGAATKVVTGGDHTCALMADKSVRCWGANRYGQLGYGHTNNIGDDETPDTAGPVPVGGKVVDVSAGGNHTCAVLESGKVRCWGWGGYGQLGYGKRRNVGHKSGPDKAGDVDLPASASAVVTGADHTCAVVGGGEVMCWGQGLFGALGYGNTDDLGDNEKPSSVGAIKLGGKVARLSAGGLVNCALLHDGTVRCWGRGSFGTLGRGNVDNVGDDETPASVPALRLSRP